jgi:hypothetical protein
VSAGAIAEESAQQNGKKDVVVSYQFGDAIKKKGGNGYLGMNANQLEIGRGLFKNINKSSSGANQGGASGNNGGGHGGHVEIAQ